MMKILVVAAHPDDEAMGCSGAMARHVDEGDEVHVAFLADGVGSRCFSCATDIAERRSVAERALEILGVESMQFLEFPDNRMDSVPLLSVVQAVEDIVQVVEPDIIYTHHIGDLNIDHQVTHKSVVTACRPQPGFCVKQIFAFEVLSSSEWQFPVIFPFSPNVFVDIRAFIETKRKILTAYGKEMRDSPHSRSIENVLRLNSMRGNTVGLEYAEAFVLIRQVI